MSDHQDPKPCPFCGERDQILASNGFESHFVFCNACGAEGPSGTTEATAIAVWNRREAAEIGASMKESKDA